MATSSVHIVHRASGREYTGAGSIARQARINGTSPLHSYCFICGSIHFHVECEQCDKCGSGIYAHYTDEDLRMMERFTANANL